MTRAYSSARPSAKLLVDTRVSYDSVTRVLQIGLRPTCLHTLWHEGARTVFSGFLTREEFVDLRVSCGTSMPRCPPLGLLTDL